MNARQKNIDSPSRRELRQFGSLLGLLLALGGGGLLWQGRSAGGLLLVAGGLVAAAFWLRCPGTPIFYAAWMRLAMVMGRVMTTLLLSVLFLCVLTPIALLGRLCGQRFLDRGFRSDTSSYWLECRKPADHRDCEKQY